MAEYELPDDLIAIQREIFAAQRRTSEAASGEEFLPAHQAEQDAVVAKYKHPYWASVPQTQRYRVDLALREAARVDE